MRPRSVLLIEDDENKQTQLLRFVATSYPDATTEIARSVTSAVIKLRSLLPDVIILDMTLPNFDFGPTERGGQTRILGGRDVLRQMDRRQIDVPVIVVTQFESFTKNFEVIGLAGLDEELADAHPSTYLGAVYYHASIDTWKAQLKDLIDAAPDRTE